MFAGIGRLECVGKCGSALQAGESVTVNVIEAIGRRISAVDEELKQGESA